MEGGWYTMRMIELHIRMPPSQLVEGLVRACWDKRYLNPSNPLPSLHLSLYQPNKQAPLVRYYQNYPFISARNMGKKDLWIASTAALLGLKLVTTDNDFQSS